MPQPGVSTDFPSVIWARLEETIRRFEEEWKAGRRPAIDRYLPGDPTERRAVLRELVHLDLEYRWKSGDTATAETYLQRYRELADDPAASAELRQAEKQFRLRFGPANTPPVSQNPTEEIGKSGDAPIDPSAGTELPTVAGYEVLRELGRGGMGVVYQARDLRLHRLVALKMLLPDTAARAAAVDRFRREAEVVARLQHPHIVQIYHVGEQAGRPFLALEFVNGGTLAERIGRTPIPGRQAAELVAPVARAVHYAHEQGLVHRDLKPANILLAESKVQSPKPKVSDQPHGLWTLDFGLWTPKVADFGLAKLLTDDSNISQSGAVIGTPCYMAPEQAMGKAAEVGPATDIYSLGAILYEMLTGQPPFHGESPMDTLLNVVAVDPVPPRRLQPKVPADLETICLKCLEKEPRRRYASAAALAEDLGRFLAGVPIQARPAGPAERLWRWGRRNPALAGLIAAVLFCLVTGTIVSTSFGIEARTSAAKTLDQKKRADEAAEKAREAEGKAVQRAREARDQERQAKENARRAELANAAAQQEKRKAQRLATSLALDHGLTLCSQGQPDHGLLWLARSLETAPEGTEDLQQSIRANLAAWRGQLHSLRLDLPHPDWVSAAAFSPDGKTILSASRDKYARLWNAKTGKPIGKPLRHDDGVRLAAFHPDGQTFATASGFKVQLWKTATKQPVGTPLVHQSRVDCMTYSPDGRYLLTATPLGTFHLWDTATGNSVDFNPEWENGQRPPPIRAVGFASDGKTVLAVLESKVYFWDLATGRFKREPLAHPGDVTALAVSPDGKTALTGCTDHLIRRWDVATGKPIGQPLLHPEGVRSVAFSPDGKLALTVGGESTVRLWELSTGQPVGQPLRHMDLQVAAFSPDGKQVLTGGLDRAVRVWEVASRNGAADVRIDQVPPQAFLSPYGNTLLTFQRDPANISLEFGGLWDARTGKFLRETARRQAFLEAAAFSPDGSLLATARLGDGIRFEETATGKPRPTHIRLRGGGVTKMVFGPGGKTLVAIGLNNTTWSIHRWDTATGKPLAPPWPMGDSSRFSYLSLAVSPDGKRVAVGLSDGTVQLRDFATGQPLPLLRGHEGNVSAIAFSSDSRTVATASRDGTARVWDAATGKPRGLPFQHFSWVHTVAFSPDGRYLLTGSNDGLARLWDLGTGKLVGSVVRLSDPVHIAGFAADGRQVRALTWNLIGARPLTIRSWTLPKPAESTADRTVLWANVATGMRLDADGTVRMLSREQWNENRRRLEDKGRPDAR